MSCMISGKNAFFVSKKTARTRWAGRVIRTRDTKKILNGNERQAPKKVGRYCEERSDVNIGRQ